MAPTTRKRKRRGDNVSDTGLARRIARRIARSIARQTRSVPIINSRARPVTRSLMETRRAVFDTAELLENIFVQLPGNEIYKSRLVSKK
ncbi:hypothetical protein BST61_g2091 [Cercospora zeina]